MPQILGFLLWVTLAGPDECNFPVPGEFKDLSSPYLVEGGFRGVLEE